MALTKKDLLEFGQELTKSLTRMRRADLRITLTEQKSELRIALDQQTQDIKRDIRDEMDARFDAFGKKMRGEIAETITDNVLPAMDRVHQDLKQEIREVRRYVGMTS